MFIIVFIWSSTNITQKNFSYKFYTLRFWCQDKKILSNLPKWSMPLIKKFNMIKILAHSLDTNSLNLKKNIQNDVQLNNVQYKYGTWIYEKEIDSCYFLLTVIQVYLHLLQIQTLWIWTKLVNIKPSLK